MDAGDALALARFWQQALGGKLVDLKDGSARVDPAPGHGKHEVIWVDPVPEPHAVRTRVHLDLELRAADPGPLLAAGAQVRGEPGKDHWWALADPDGNEFRAYPPGGGASSREHGLVAGVVRLSLDCAQPQAQAAWWAGVLGGTVHGSTLRGAAGFPWHEWLFQGVPEPKAGKNRIHWDVTLAGPTPDALVARGATVLREPGGDISWWVLADPEGNEFCGFARK
jgi:hypothetical protein